MAKSILMEEFHVSVWVPRGLEKSAYAAIRRTLIAARFRAELQRAVRGVAGRRPSLRLARFVLTR